MKLGIIGGIAPESTIDYYQRFIRAYQAQTKDGSYPEIIINSVNMAKMLGLVANQDWAELINYLSTAVNQLAQAGATYGLMASNTPHIVFEEIQARSEIPLLSIVSVTCEKVKEYGFKRVGLLGTSFTMQSDYYQQVFNPEGIAIFVPETEEQGYIQGKISSELHASLINPETKKGLLSIVQRLAAEYGIEAVILGCTELPLILTEDQFGLKFINTSQVHVESAIKYMK